MDTLQAQPRVIQGVRRRELLKAGLAAGVTLSAWPPRGPRGSGRRKPGYRSAVASSGYAAMIRRTLTPISPSTSRPIPR